MAKSAALTKVEAALNELKAESQAAGFDWADLLKQLGPLVLQILLAILAKQPPPAMKASLKAVGCDEDSCESCHAIACHCLEAADLALAQCCKTP